MISLKTEEEIQIMKKGGKILSTVMDILIKSAKPGVKLIDLDLIAEEEIRKRGAEPSFLKVPGYEYSICACVNEVIVHGIPDEYVIKEGDVVGIDCGVYLDGFHTDSSWTIRVPIAGKTKKDEIDIFLDVGKEALYNGIAQVKEGNYIYDVSSAIEKTIKKAGYSIARELIGHGVGKELHEDPEVPGIAPKNRLKTPKITRGLVIAVEVIYMMGKPAIAYRENDEWTIVTKDGTLSGLFEATVAVSSHGSLVLTSTYA
jgi:methionyl aminopeptidase